jgi:tetratricopeptide (TPR) repeat protein
MPASARPQSRGLAALLCTSVAVASLVSTPARAAPAEDSSTADAEAIFRRGQTKYETADYNGAIELWTEAYGLIDSTPENASIKALLIYNLAQAHVKAYELDAQEIHLKQAQQLLISFRNNLALLYDEPAQLAEETATVEGKLAEIDAMITALEQAKAAAAEQNKPEPEPEPEPEPKPEPPPPAGPSGKPLIISGGVLLGVGVGLGALGIVGAVMGSNAEDISDLQPLQLDEREQRYASGYTGNILLIVGAVGAGLLLPTGAALIGVGAKRNKAHAATRSRLEQLRVGPSFSGGSGRGLTGISITGRF